MEIRSINSYSQQKISYPSLKKNQNGNFENKTFTSKPDKIPPYQAYCNISFGNSNKKDNGFYSVSDIKGRTFALCKDTTVRNNEAVTMSVDAQKANLLLTNDSGEYDNEKVSKFFSIYEKILKEDIAAIMEPLDLNSLKHIGEGFATIMSEIDKILQEEPLSSHTANALKKTCIQFMVEQATYFKADKEKVELLSDTIACTNSQIGNDYIKYTNAIIKNSMDKEGHLDLDFADDLCYVVSVAHVASSFDIAEPNINLITKRLKQFIDVDPEQKENIIRYFAKLASQKDIQSEEGNFLRTFGYSFNDKTHKFDEKRAELVLELIDESFEYFDIYEDDPEYLQDYKEKEEDVLNKYFKLNTNPETGELNSSYISPEFFAYSQFKDWEN